MLESSAVANARPSHGLRIFRSVASLRATKLIITLLIAYSGFLVLGKRLALENEYSCLDGELFVAICDECINFNY